MFDQLNSNQQPFELQSELHDWLKIIEPLYLSFVPQTIQHRRNTDQAKLSDTMVLALMCWQVDLKMTTQTRFYHFLQHNVFLIGELPERSRFNRLCRLAGTALQFIRTGLVRTCVESIKFAIIDSLPLPLCQPVRNVRAKVLHGRADIGYNATKKLHYYGLKGSFETTSDGMILAYTITKASIHDIQMVKTLLDMYPVKQVLADVGYLSQRLKAECAEHHINFWTPVRKNMVQPRTDQHLLNRQRRRIETTFAQLEALFDIETIHVQTADGFQSRIEQCLLVHTMRKLGIN